MVHGNEDANGDDGDDDPNSHPNNHHTNNFHTNGYTKENTTVADGSITGGDVDEDVWTNTLTAEVDTGISMDSMPYILLLAVAAMGLAVLFTRKRMMREN